MHYELLLQIEQKYMHYELLVVFKPTSITCNREKKKKKLKIHIYRAVEGNICISIFDISIGYKGS